ncbi:unnamed protein product [Gadus morhua 'NCC']
MVQLVANSLEVFLRLQRRVTLCHGKCSLRINDLRQSDSAVYKFRFTTNLPGGKYTGDPGVTLSVTDLQVKVSFPYPTDPTKAKLECHSMCDLAGDPRYIWFRNGQNVLQGINDWIFIQSGESYSCAVEGYENLHSPLVYAPKTPSVTMSPSGEIEEGSSVTLNCSSDANPAANYTWFKVNRDGSSRNMNQGQQLIFKHILSSESGQFRCDTQNKLGERSLSISINVKYGPKHISVLSSPSGEIKEGSSVTLNCSSDANPAAEYTWFKNNQPLLWEPPHTFPSVRPEDRGTYRCQAENKYGQLSSNLLFMDVQYAPKTPSVTVNPSGEIEEGSSVTLSCSSDANPAAEYTWFKDNQPLLWGPSQRHTFPSVRPEDRGTYRCQAENQYGQLSSNSIFMDVQYAPKTPSVTVSPSGEIEEGSSVTLSCSSDANPAATYTWFRVISAHSSREVKQGVGPHLVFRSILSSDSGQYYCLVKTELRTKSELIDITVKYAPKTPSVTVRPSGEIEEGSSVTLSCSSDANPAAEYTWFKNNQPLLWGPSQPHTFPSVRPEDRGTYRCEAKNQYGQLSSNSIFMDVQYAPKTPSVTVSPSGEIEEGSSVTLSCSSDANPAATYTWFKNNRRLLWGRSQPHTFPSVRPEDRGTYRCEAKNQYGLLSSNLLFMDVQYAPKTPSVTVRPSGEIEEGSSVTLRCSSDANPVATYTWFKVNRAYPSREMEGRKLVLSRILSSESGQYRCEATNKWGKDSVTYSINVNYGPKHTSVLSSPSGEIEEGSSVTLSCSSDANPAAEYTWFKNNQPLLWGPSQPHTFPSVRHEDRGTYRCHAKNKYGQLSSNSIIMDVQYAPKTTSVTVSPSGEIEEGSSVTLSCSSDANPAAEYTWFKNNQPLPWGPSQPHTFPSVRPEDRGTYRCHAENQYGHLSSNSMFLNVTYDPKTPSVTVSPSGEIEEGSSVTLSCSSDANPAANYTWFKEH